LGEKKSEKIIKFIPAVKLNRHRILHTALGTAIGRRWNYFRDWRIYKTRAGLVRFLSYDSDPTLDGSCCHSDYHRNPRIHIQARKSAEIACIQVELKEAIARLTEAQRKEFERDQAAKRRAMQKPRLRIRVGKW
jgi:hypothetical protein